MFQIIDNNNMIINGKNITLPLTIHKSFEKKIPYIIELNKLTIVNFLQNSEEERLIAKQNPEIGYRNVWAFDKEGNVAWKIERLKWVENESGPYTAIYIKDDQLLAYNFVGTEVIVNADDGTVKIVHGGRPW